MSVTNERGWIPYSPRIRRWPSKDDLISVVVTVTYHAICSSPLSSKARSVWCKELGVSHATLDNKSSAHGYVQTSKLYLHLDSDGCKA